MQPPVSSKSTGGRNARSGSEFQRTLIPRDIPVPIELASDTREDANELEAETLVQRHGLRVRQADPGDDPRHVLTRDRVEERRIQSAADAASDGIAVAVDRRFDGGVV